MGDNGDPTPARDPGQNRRHAGAEIGEALTSGRAVIGEGARRHPAEIGQFGIAEALPLAEILLPQRGIALGAFQFRPERPRGLAATKRRAGDRSIGPPEYRAHRLDRRRVTGIGRNIGTPAKPPAIDRRSVPDKDQLCRAAVLQSRFPPFVTAAFLLCHRSMGKTILITGGARSGKSGIAETKTRELGQHAVYIATAEAHDAEMAARIAEHRARRGAGWTTRAEPIDLVAALEATDGQGPRLVDCLTMWLTNLMIAERDWRTECHALVRALPGQKDPVVIVTNEVGGGIVPDNALAREFRDAAGLLNQWVAAVADEVHLAVAGLPLKVK